ncbi:MAG: ABC transporter permease, partial [Vicinamibacterales bacterium]
MTPFDPRAEVRRHVGKSGVELPETTIDELGAYLEDLHAAALDEGANPFDARARALAALEESAFSLLQAHALRHPDHCQAARADLMARSAGGRSLNVLSAIRLAVRQFRQHPTFAVVTVLVLGIGTGAATTVFTVVDSVVLRPLPYADADRLVTLWDTNPEKGIAHDPISPVNFMDYRALPVFSDAAAWWRPGINLTESGKDPIRVTTIEVGGNVFDVLGVKPQIGVGFPSGGRMFATNELICVISDRLWRTRFSGDPSIIGKALSFNDTPYTVVGVMAPKFHFPDDVDVWQRVRWDFTQHSRAAHFMEAVARLSPGTTFEQAQSAVEALGTRLAQANAPTNNGWNARLIPLLDEELGYYRPALMVLFGAVALLLLIAVLNVATLLLTRACGSRPVHPPAGADAPLPVPLGPGTVDACGHRGAGALRPGQPHPARCHPRAHRGHRRAQRPGPAPGRAAHGRWRSLGPDTAGGYRRGVAAREPGFMTGSSHAA